MSSTTNRIPILIVGATGNLGRYVTKFALEHENLLVNILVRESSKSKELNSQVEAAGGKVIRADLADKTSLNDVTKGMHTVISTVGAGDEKATVEGHIALIDDCVKNGVKRFVPSDFGMNYTDISREEMLASHITAYKVKVEDHLKTTSLPNLRIYTGCIAETLFSILGQEHKYWGDENLKQEITTYENTARLVVAAVSRPDFTGRVTYCGSRHTPQKIQDIYNNMRGTNVELKRAGSLDDLRELMESKKKEGDKETAGFLALLVLVYDKRSKFGKTDNDEFWEVKPTLLEEFIEQNPNITL